MSGAESRKWVHQIFNQPTNHIELCQAAEVSRNFLLTVVEACPTIHEFTTVINLSM